MNEKLYDALNDRLTRMEGKLDQKLDKLLEQNGSQDGRLIKLEGQAGFVKWLAAVVGAGCAALLNWSLGHIKWH